MKKLKQLRKRIMDYSVFKLLKILLQVEQINVFKLLRPINQTYCLVYTLRVKYS